MTSVHPELRGVAGPCGTPRESFTPHVESYGRAHCALDYDLANVGMVRVDGGFVVIDTASTLESARGIRGEFEKLAGGSPKAVIYTHSHPDHIGGADAFCDAGAPIWAQRQFAEELEVTQLLPAAYFNRGAKQFGAALPIEIVASDTIGPPYRLSDQPRPPLRLPTDLFSERAAFEIGGVRFELHSAPGETHDQIFVWLPEERVLFAGDNIYRAFPNLYAIRGVPPRPVRRWIDSLDAMRRLDPPPELLMLGHTETVRGAEAIRDLLTVYRDAIARVHDGVVAGINAGLGPDELVEQIRLPADLREHPYLQERYGTLRGSIRGVYAGYMGWFDGDAANLDPLPLAEVAANLLPALGGADGALRQVDSALASGKIRWALWLAQAIVAAQPNHKAARAKKAELLDRIAADTYNPLMQNWLRSDAELLRGAARLPPKPRINGRTIAEMPVEQIVRMMPSRLHPQRAATFTTRIGYDFSDSGRQFTFHVRRGIGEVAPGLDPHCELTIRATEKDFRRIFVAGEVKPLAAEFWQRIQFITPNPGVCNRFRILRLLLRLRKSMIQL